MSTATPQEDPLESGAVSLNDEEEIETLLVPYPLPKSDQETAPAEENSAGEEEDDDEEEGEGEETEEETTPTDSSNMDLRIQPPVTDPHASSTLASPSSRRGGSKRKKGKGKTNIKKQQAIEEKLQTLKSNLNPIPFVPHRLFYFPNHEKLLKKLGLWDFVHIEFGKEVRVDLIAQLVANYNPKSRCSRVNSYRINVNRADLGRALKLPSMKEKSNAGGGEAELDSEILRDESLVFINGLVSDWMLLHEDPWFTPHEVTESLKMIKDGHSEKVDWAGLLWFMVEKELKQGGELVDCYYASHLQQLIKHQREELFLVGEEPEKGEVESDARVFLIGEEPEKGEVESDARVFLIGEEPEKGEVESDARVFLIGEEPEKGEVESDARVFLIGEEPEKGEVESDARVKEVEGVDDEENIKDSDAVECHVGGDTVVEGPSTELTLGQDGEKEEEEETEMEEEEEVKEVEMTDAETEKCSESDVERGGEEEEGEGEEEEGEGEQQWLLNGKTNLGDHFMQPCNGLENSEDFVSLEEIKDEEDEEMDGGDEYEEEEEEDEEEEARNNFHVFPDDDDPLVGEEFTGNFLQGMEANPLAFSSHEQFRNASSVDARADVQHIVSTPSFFNNSGKRVIEHEHDYHHAVNDNNKRLRMNETWDNKPQDIGMCVAQMQQLAQTFKMLNDEREQAMANTDMNQQLLLSELQKRDSVIEHLHKASEETRKKDVLIGRLERELHLVGSVLDGYKRALRETRKAFAEYREKAQLYEEPTYKDAGPGAGGLMLTAAEIERRRKKKDEEFKRWRLFYEQVVEEMGEQMSSRMDGYVESANLLDTRVIRLEANAKELIALRSKRKIPPVEEKMPQVVETLEPKEAVPEEVSKTLPVPEPEEHVREPADHPPIPQTDEEVIEDAEPEAPAIEQKEDSGRGPAV